MRRVAFALLLVLAAGALARPRGPAHVSAPPEPSGERVHSFLAIGDTGKRPSAIPIFDTLPNVAHGAALEDERAPVDALLLLGDNFYPKGLLGDELVERILGNVVIPFCRFVRLAEGAPMSLERSCSAHHPHHPVPLYVIPGNHDATTPESLALERQAIPRYVANWHMPPGPVDVAELRDGISLVLVDDDALEHSADPTPLVEALAGSRGPWRLLLIHKPLRSDATSQLVRRAIERSGVTVQILLAGHEHSLQLREPGSPGPALEVVSGGGSNADPIPPGGPPSRFAVESPGFARIDLVRTANGHRILVSLFSVERRRILAAEHPTLVARASVGLAGDVRSEIR